MKMRKLIESAGLSIPGNLRDFEVKGVTADSRKISDGFVFVAVKGANFNGHNFIREAIKRGAKAIIGSAHSSQLTTHRNIPYIRVDDTRRALADLSAAFWGYPSSSMKLVGITGTNGKTTVSYLIESILKCAQCSPAVIGTVDYRFKDTILKADNTTPGSSELQELLARMRKEKVDYVVIEVSSHALDQERVRAVEFTCGIFTNLSAEHLDYHRDLNSYFAAKSKLFKELLCEKSFAILNADDPYAVKLSRLTKACVVTYGLGNEACVYARDLRFGLQGADFLLRLNEWVSKNFARGTDTLSIKTSLIGKHNIYNILAAIAFGLTQKIDPQILKAGVERFTGVPGRLEMVLTQKNFYVFVDYAHTEDALKNAIMSLRPLCKGRLIVVFGCGGNRDKTKRPKMGRVASELADFTIITTDNPRNEEPEQIIDEIISGIDNKNLRIIVDRKDAIKEAISLAGKDDIILIAGKGHENYQIFKDRIIHFDDREVVKECLDLKR